MEFVNDQFSIFNFQFQTERQNLPNEEKQEYTDGYDVEKQEYDRNMAAESIDANSESQLHTDEEFEDMMEQLLERDGGGPEIIAEALEQQLAPGLDSSLDDTHHDSQVSFEV